MKVRVNADACVGHGRCYSLAPVVFAPDDRGHCEILVEELTPELEEQARLGVANCPEQAIYLED